MLVKPPSPLATLPSTAPRPAGLFDGTWTAVRIDASGAFDFGPSLLEIVMWIPAEGSLIDHVLGRSYGVATVTLSREAVHALVPHLAAALPAEDNIVRITGDTYAPTSFEGGGYFGARVVRVPGGLLVAVRVGG